MLQIRLSKPASESGGGAKSLPPDNVTVACPDHLVLADLPVAKSLGTVNAAAAAASLVKTVGRRSRRQLGDRVHFCVRCDFPIAIYGRLKATILIAKVLQTKASLISAKSKGIPFHQIVAFLFLISLPNEGSSQSIDLLFNAFGTRE
ncbi:hypothetical protein CQW23_21619 [Capsicum baccatum]|uniref:Uncharacterized protein n=1 Tax=Capsicum baccatum TaxID=33114 RepID=A0A2G2VYH7_CAPBA|nr:hypothetical protein CQW23_21617 [Capsicum baccatum]PHT38046.1 hypothetical protein CQW23_21619 [Capsicum baccatum]